MLHLILLLYLFLYHLLMLSLGILSVIVSQSVLFHLALEQIVLVLLFLLELLDVLVNLGIDDITLVPLILPLLVLVEHRELVPVVVLLLDLLRGVF